MQVRLCLLLLCLFQLGSMMMVADVCSEMLDTPKTVKQKSDTMPKKADDISITNTMGINYSVEDQESLNSQQNIINEPTPSDVCINIEALKLELKQEVRKEFAHELELQTNLIKNAEQKTERDADITLWVISIFSAIFLVLVVNCIINEFRVQKIFKQAKKANKQSEEASLAYQKYQEQQNEMQRYILSEDSIASKPIKELQDFAIKTAPFAQAMLASRGERWELANYLWQEVCLIIPEHVEARFQLVLSFIKLREEVNTGLLREEKVNTELKNILWTKFKEELEVLIALIKNSNDNIKHNIGKLLGNLVSYTDDRSEKQYLLEKGIEIFKQVLSNTPNDVTNLHNAGSYSLELAIISESKEMKKDLLERAKAHLQNANKVGPDSDVIYNLARCYSELAKLEDETTPEGIIEKKKLFGKVIALLESISIRRSLKAQEILSGAKRELVRLNKEDLEPPKQDLDSEK